MSSPFRSEHAPAVKVCLMWFDKLLACLDATVGSLETALSVL